MITGNNTIKITIVLFFGITTIFIKSWILPAQKSSALDLTVENILTTVNKERVARNLPSLYTDLRLSSAAQYKSEDMTKRKYFSHTNPEGEYIWPTIVAMGYTPYLQLGENLAIQFADTETLVNAWMNSPTHRENILNAGFKDQGMGLSFGTESAGEYFSSVANTFGTLLNSKKTSPVAAPSADSSLKMPTPTKTQTAPKQKTTPQKKVAETPKPKAANTAQGATSNTPLAENVNNPVISTLPETPPSSSSATPPSPIQTRGDAEKLAALNTPEQNFALPPAHDIQTSASGTEPTEATQYKPKVANPYSFFWKIQKIKLEKQAAFLMGLILLIFLILDIKNSLSGKIEMLDKKINNTILLILAIVMVMILMF